MQCKRAIRAKRGASVCPTRSNTVYLDCQICEIVEEWKEHCTVTNRTLVLSSIYPPPIKDGTIFRFPISYHCQRQKVPSVKNTGPISLLMVMMKKLKLSDIKPPSRDYLEFMNPHIKNIEKVDLERFRQTR